jgi:hypothetical protein
MDQAALIQRIRKVFPAHPAPNPDNVVVGSSGEAVSVKSLLAGTAWMALKNEDLLRENSALGFLTDEAFRYYLPAYMMLLLTDLKNADILASSVIRQLTLPLEVDTLRLMNYLAESGNTNKGLNRFLEEELRNSSSNAGAFIRRMNGYTPEQGKVINQFLLLLNKEHADYYDEQEPAIASERYWFKYGA